MMNTKMLASLCAAAAFLPLSAQAATSQEEATTSAAAIVQVAQGTQAQAPAVEARKGSMIYSDGKRIGQVFRVRENGDAQVVINGQSHIVPAETLIEKDGKLATTLSRSQVVSGR
ncbi:MULTISPECIES: hypothetical protein [Novosphingobium]|uniref:MSHA biogenesis protein MshK n=1 Tax=Novosphingobium decolorationis TaxID=2698673 RepID=A0ABX8E7S8_9SPHN|nr:MULTISPECIES: hypothetical protein [Novosphingobium]QVM84649.1 hypothetical protein HT578_14055 [Novosphingobium decolorationis]GAM04307.1 hypothetical protein MBENS4_1305 [Novosphingobium sp. MBES04]